MAFKYTKREDYFGSMSILFGIIVGMIIALISGLFASALNNSAIAAIVFYSVMAICTIGIAYAWFQFRKLPYPSV